MDIFGLFTDRKRKLEALAAERKAARKAARKATMKIRVKSRIDEVLDQKSGMRLFEDIGPSDPLEFPGYAEKVAGYARRCGYPEAFICKTGTIDGRQVVCAELLADFMMGSMGTATGEAITRSVEYARLQKLPLIIFSASGGARMQEGIFSLMQMAKTSAALRAFSDEGGLYLSVLTHPTTGGVTASFAMLGDIILAEPGALIGFAGPRVIEQTINATLPEGFQSAEFQREHGFVDAIVSRCALRPTLSDLLALHDAQPALPASSAPPPVVAPILPPVQRTALTPQQQVERARHPARPHISTFIEELFDNFFETHGDRAFADDGALICGIARFEGRSVTVAGHVKGTDLSSNIRSNFGMPHPEGYRKFIRACRQAEKFGRPVITFIDTPGAYPGPGAEERGQGEAIARCLYETSGLKVPLIAIITGEGGSGGALALGVADSLAMLEHAVYSVLSPEGFASILWKDAKRSAEASALMKLTARDMLEARVVDLIVTEPESWDLPEETSDAGTAGAGDDDGVTADGGAADSATIPAREQTREAVFAQLRGFIRSSLNELAALDAHELVAKRTARYRRFS